MDDGYKSVPVERVSSLDTDVTSPILVLPNWMKVPLPGPDGRTPQQFIKDELDIDPSDSLPNPDIIIEGKS